MVFVAAVMASHTARGQAVYPVKPIRIVVPSSAGGTQDTLARLVGGKLGEAFKQPAVVENRPGAGGMIGAESILRAPADGYTLGISTISTLDSFQKIYRPEIYNANSPAGKSYRPSLNNTDFSFTRIVYDREERSRLAMAQGIFAKEHFIQPCSAFFAQSTARAGQ